VAENSNISWTDHTFNPWIGCTRVSPACDGCYAAELMGTEGGRFKRVTWGEPGAGEGTRDRTKDWSKPRKWNREAANAMATYVSAEAYRERHGGAGIVVPKPAPTFVFCASLADVFDNKVDPSWRRDLFDLIRETPNLTWLLLTKRPGMIVRLYQDQQWLRVPPSQKTIPLPGLTWPRNAAIGCTVVNQEEADRDVPKLLAAKAALQPAFAFLSMEPLLGPVDLTGHLWGRATPCAECSRDADCGCGFYPRGACDGEAAIDWVITGGETDQGKHMARPADPSWYRSLRDQCAAAGVPFHFKQWGEWQPASEHYADFEPLMRAQRDYVHRGAQSVAVLEGGAQLARIGKDHDPCTLDGVQHLARPVV
jgi:protein gp37